MMELSMLVDLTSWVEAIGEYDLRRNGPTEISVQARSYRSQFFDTIIRVTELMKLLPEYKIDPVQDAINRETLYFDKTIGEV